MEDMVGELQKRPPEMHAVEHVEDAGNGVKDVAPTDTFARF